METKQTHTLKLREKGDIKNEFPIDLDNKEFNYAIDFIQNTDKIVYITGKAGTGKTTFLRHLRTVTNKSTIVLAPTGVAAINAGGQTIHSYFQIKPGVYLPYDKRLRFNPEPNDLDKSTIYDHFRYYKDKSETIRATQLLIIDEISMVRCDLLDLVDKILRYYRQCYHKPFGGVQVVLIGDTFQLPPIAEHEHWDILKTCYDSEFFFSSRVIQENPPVYIELKKIYRQNESAFIDILNKVRVNEVNFKDLKLLNSKYQPQFEPPEDENYIMLATHNKIVDETNLTKLDELPGDTYEFEALIDGVFPDSIFPTERVLQLKIGAQIIFIKNNSSKNYYNGKIGVITDFGDNKIIVTDAHGEEISVDPFKWENIRFSLHKKTRKIEEDVVGTFRQFPIKLAWAITVHKSQGLTFEKVIADLGGAFAPGQVYVALSRCTSFSGLVLKSKIDFRAIKTNPKVIEFAKNEINSVQIESELNSGKADLYYEQSRTAFKAQDFEMAYDLLMRAIKCRNDMETDLFKRWIVANIKRLSENTTKNSEIEKIYRMKVKQRVLKKKLD